MLSRLKALTLLSECTGEEIWSLEHCRLRGVPEAWLDELVECFESGFDRDDQTIYVGEAVVNQYHGLRDFDLAMKLGEYLGLDVETLHAVAPNRGAFVRGLCEAIEEQ